MCRIVPDCVLYIRRQVARARSVLGRRGKGTANDGVVAM